MGESIAALLPPLHQQTLRSAGTVGAEWFRLCAVHHKSIGAYVFVTRSWVDQYLRISSGVTAIETASPTPIPPLPVDLHNDDDPLLVSPCLHTRSGGIPLTCDLVMEGRVHISTFHHHPVLVINWHRLLELKTTPLFSRALRVAVSAPFVQVMDATRVSSEEVSVPSFVRVGALQIAMSPSEDAHLITEPPYSMVESHRLQHITMDSFINVTTIGNNFMRDCAALQSMDLAFASKVVSVGSSFMTGCSAIKSIDLSPLGRVISVGNDFMATCSGLCSVAGLETWTSLSSAGSGFLSSCSALKEVELFPLRSFLTNSPTPTISSNLLSHCTSLARVRFAESDARGPLNPLRIESNVLSHCGALTSVAFECGEEYTVVEIGTSFIADATALKGVDVSSMCNLHSVGDTFLNGCVNLEAVELFRLSQDDAVSTSVGLMFLGCCSSLTKVDLKPLNGVRTVMSSFLYSCHNLGPTIDLEPLSRVATVGPGFLNKCSSLKYLDLNPMRGALKSWAMAFEGCDALRKVYVGMLPAGHPALRSIPKRAISTTEPPPSRVDFNALMGSYMMAILPPPHQAMLRRSGKVAGHWFYQAAVISRSVRAYAFTSKGWCDQVHGVEWGLSSEEVASPNPVHNLPIHIDSLPCNDGLHVSPCRVLWRGMDIIPDSHCSPNHHQPVLILNFRRLSELINTKTTQFSSSGTWASSHRGNRRLCLLFQTTSAPLIQIDQMDGIHAFGVDEELKGCLAVELCISPTVPLHDVTTVSSMASGSTFLRKICMDSFINVTTIGNNFMRDCAALQSMDLAFASKVVSVGSSFMTGCSAIKSIDLSPLGRVISVGNDFMATCSGLCSVAGLETWTSLSSAGSGFLSSCSALKEVELFPLRSFLTNSPTPTISSNLLSHCTSLARVRFAESDARGPLNPLRIESNVLSHCGALTSVAFECGEEYTVVEIGTSFIADATALKGVDVFAKCDHMLH